ncbi:MAG: hypothetical protein KF805_13440 [Phycisphaeraceae bacterium]|nr:hypothetical protein [Phycisphaeraceae bacterium]
MSACFSPSLEQVSSVLDSVCDPARSLLSIAEEMGTPVHALCAWLNLPEIVERIEQMAQGIARRVRLVAASQMSLVLDTARAIVAGVARDEALLAAQPPDPKTLALRRASRQVGLGAMRLLVRLSTFDPRSAPARQKVAARQGGSGLAPSRPDSDRPNPDRASAAQSSSEPGATSFSNSLAPIQY